jgi:KDO2-lipid IV(A) lauroyltransferase
MVNPATADPKTPAPTDSPGASWLQGALVSAVFWLIGTLPMPWLHRLGRWAGRRRRGRTRRIVETNLQLCFPALDTPERTRLVDLSLAEAGASMLEAFRIWTRPRRSLRLIREIRGAEILAEARAEGRGVLLLAPHLGAWELLSLHLATLGPGGVLYRPPASPAVEAAIVRARGTLGMEQIRADRNAPRTLIRRFAKGELVGILPDQQPKVGEGVFAPFFDVQALTMTLAPRLAQRVPTVFGWAERLPDSAGFRLHFKRAPAALADPDPVVAAGALNAAIEDWVREHPEQYVWTYKRFSRRPAGEPPRYGADTRRQR